MSIFALVHTIGGAALFAFLIFREVRRTPNILDPKCGLTKIARLYDD